MNIQHIARGFITYVAIPAFFYPVYFIIANGIDSVAGDQQLINWLYFESHSLLVKTFLTDWLAALPVMFGIYYLLIMPVHYFVAKTRLGHLLIIACLCAIIFGILSFLIGFRNQGLITNGLSVFVFVIIYGLNHKIAKRTH